LGLEFASKTWLWLSLSWMMPDGFIDAEKELEFDAIISLAAKLFWIRMTANRLATIISSRVITEVLEHNLCTNRFKPSPLKNPLCK